MLTRAQQILLKRAQREAGISDADYRDALQIIANVRSSTSPAFTDRHLDKALGYFEALFWHAVDAGRLQPSSSANAVFRQRGYWARKNSKQETSRDRFTGSNLTADINALESKLALLGYGSLYCAGIRQKVTGGRDDEHARHLYRAALGRTLRAKSKPQAVLAPD